MALSASSYLPAWSSQIGDSGIQSVASNVAIGAEQHMKAEVCKKGLSLLIFSEVRDRVSISRANFVENKT